MRRRHYGQRRQILGSVLIATALSTVGDIPKLSAQGAPEPEVLRSENKGQPGTGTTVGFLYTPHVLSALASRMPSGAVPAVIGNAIQQGTPIVAMLEFPANPDYQHQRPYHLAIVEQDRPDAGADGSIQPLWVQQEAGDLARLDLRLASPEMRLAAIAAFPAWAFVPGRLVLIHSTPELRESGMRSSQRWGLIRWDGTVTDQAQR